MTKNTVFLKKWKFKNEKDTEWIDATIPSSIHMDLYKHKLIPHPYEEQNEKTLQWIDKQNWEYEAEFSVTEEITSHTNIDMVFEGLDTITSIYINNELALKTDNMFRTWQIDLKEHIFVGKNTIKVVLNSPIQYGLEQLENSEYILPAPMDDSQMGEIGDNKVSMFIRKAPYHFGWDWGPRFATSGIWRDVKLEYWSSLDIKDLSIHQKHITEERAEIVLETEIQSDFDQSVGYTLKFKDTIISETINLTTGTNSLKLPVTIEKPDLWWTHDLGEQALTAFKLTLITENNSVSKEVAVGLRSIKLVREKDRKGETFFFNLNGLPLFIKGANHIPLDTFIPEIEETRYKKEIEHAKDANMNMLRVWGGGIYEQKAFYQACDKEGILVWQDFMFACSMYPATKEFINNVAVEAEENIKRLRNHACIALWCGNNEIDSMWKEFTDQTYLKWKEQYTPDIRNKLWNGYDEIFHRLLPELIEKRSPETDYWPSSPMAELSYSEEQHASLDSPKGDIHLWNVWHSYSPIEDYNNYIGRFMSEYGFQSYPDYKIFSEIIEEKNLSIDSESISFRQKNKTGNEILQYYMKKYYSEATDFNSFSVLSQYLQGFALDTAIRAHRRLMPYCMGTLYWQLNDSWPGASWSTIDYYGNRKLSHYSVKEAFKSTIISFEENENSLDVYAVSDSLSEQNVSLKITIFSLNDHSIVDQISNKTFINKRSSTLLTSIDKSKMLESNNKNEIYVLTELKSENGSLLDEYVYFFNPIKETKLTKPLITFEQEIKDNMMYIHLESDSFAKSVNLSIDIDGEFEHNSFDLIPNKKKTVLFRADVPLSNKKVDVRVNSVVDYLYN